MCLFFIKMGQIHMKNSNYVLALSLSYDLLHEGR